MEGAEPTGSAAKACPGGICTARFAPSSDMRRIASYHCTGRATAWARSSRTAADSARTRRPPVLVRSQPSEGRLTVIAQRRVSPRLCRHRWRPLALSAS
jgi:hypothetical protein